MTDAEYEEQVVRDKIEHAAQVIAAGDDRDEQVREKAALMHDLHPTYAYEILLSRLGHRVGEIVDLTAAERVRLARDIEDRASRVVSGEQTFDEAAAAVTWGYPGRNPEAVTEALMARVREIA